MAYAVNNNELSVDKKPSINRSPFFCIYTTYN